MSAKQKQMSKRTELELELLAALKAMVRALREQVHLAREMAGDLAVNEGNGPAYRMARDAIYKAEGRE